MAQTRVETLDIFRGVSILLVALYHYTARLPADALNMTQSPLPAINFGWIGVYFFFVLSGYCIFLTLERAKTIQIFLARRFSRIYPAYLAATVGLFIFGLFAFVPSVPESNYHEVAAGPLDVVLNLLFVAELGEWVNGSFWSIAVEVKYYLLVALLAVFFGTGAKLVRTFAALSLVMTAIWVASSVLLPTNGRMNAAALIALVTIAPYLPFFAFGILARHRQTTSNKVVGWLIATGIAMAAVLLVKCLGFGSGGVETMAMLGGVMGSFAILVWAFVSFINGQHLPHIPVISRTIAAMGFLSYSWYLLHEPVGFSLMSAFGPHVPAWINVLIALAGTYAISWVFAQAVEWRFRKAFEAAALWVLAVIGKVWPFSPPAAATE